MKGLWPRLLDNASWLFTGAAARSVLGFATMVYLARVLGPEMFGRVGFALAVLTYFILLTDGGLQALGTREVAAERGTVGTLAGRVLVIRGGLTALSLLVIFSCASILTPSASTARLLMIFSLALIPISANLSWVFRGAERMKIVGLSELLQVGSYFLLLLLLVHGPDQLILVPVVFVAGHCLATILLWGGHRRNWGHPRLSPAGGGHLTLLSSAFPVVLTLFLQQICFSFDTVMLGFMRTDQEVGWYSATFRIVFTVIAVNTVLMQSVFPTFSKLFRVGTAALRQLLEKSLTLSLVIVLPVGIGSTLLARPLILAMYGPEYEGSILALKLLIWSAVIVFLGTNYGFCLVACGRQRALAWVTAAGALINIVLNLWLIPRHGIFGACLATLISQGLLLYFQGTTFSRNVTRALPLPKLSLKALVAGLSMGLFLFLLGAQLNVWLAVAIGASIYVGIFWLLARRELRDLFDLAAE